MPLQNFVFWSICRLVENKVWYSLVRELNLPSPKDLHQAEPLVRSKYIAHNQGLDGLMADNFGIKGQTFSFVYQSYVLYTLDATKIRKLTHNAPKT